MAVAYVNNGAFASGIASAAVPQPASPAAGNIYIAHAGGKPFGSVPTSTYARLGSGTSGSVANGNGTGSVIASAWRHDVMGSESGNITFSIASGSPTMGRMQQFSKSSSMAWGVASTYLADTSETGTGVDTSGSGSDVGFTTGDFISIGVFIKDDVPTHTSQSFTIPGCTLSSVTWETVSTTTSGNDGAFYLGRCSVSSGTSSGPPRYQATSSVSGASSVAVSVVRLREVTPTAVTFGAASQELTRTLSLGAKTVFTIAGWFRIDFDPDTFHGPWQMGNSGRTDYVSFATTSDGVTIQTWNETSNLGGTLLTVGVWYFAMVVVNGGTSTFYWAPDGDPTLDSTALTSVGSTPFDLFEIGHGEGTGDWFRGSVCAPKAWDAALTQTEGETEMTQKLAVRTTSLIFSYGLEGTADVNDQSGNSYNLSGGSGLRNGDGPNVIRGTLGGGGGVTARPGPVISSYSGMF